MSERPPVLLTGATGYVGGRLLADLLAAGRPVRCLVRDPGRARLPAGAETVRGDLVAGEGVEAALDGTEVAYYLVHSMGAGRDFAERDRRAADRFGQAARKAGVRRVVYLGGLGPTGEDASEHLRSRHEVAEVLGEAVDQLVYARAAMVIGAGSASFEMLRHLVQRLPAMVCPRWIDTRSQPVALADVVGALVALGELPDAPSEVHLGGADVLTYREMMLRFAELVGRRRPLVLRVPVLSPRLSSYWVGLVTPVQASLVRPLVDGLRSEMVVERPPPPGVNDSPMGFDAAVRAALGEEAPG
jgi:uncharacterized protein YbjT (DUF2867 family)